MKKIKTNSTVWLPNILFNENVLFEKGRELYPIAIFNNAPKMKSGQALLVYDKELGLEVIDVDFFEGFRYDGDIAKIDLQNFNIELEKEKIKENPTVIFQLVKQAIEQGYKEIGIVTKPSKYTNLIDEIELNSTYTHVKSYVNGKIAVRENPYFGDLTNIRFYRGSVCELRGSSFDFCILDGNYSQETIDIINTNTIKGSKPIVITIKDDYSKNSK